MSETAQFEAPLPAAVRRQIAASDALVQQLKGGQVPLETPAEAVPDAPSVAPEAPPVAQEPVEAAPPAPRARKAPDLEQQLRTLQGKYNSELPAATQRAVLAEQREVELRDVNADLRRQLAAATTAPPVAPARPFTADPADVETYGLELINKARGWARAEFEPEIAGLRDQLARVENQGKAQAERLQQTTQMSAQDRVHAALDAAMPDWRVQNNDPAFETWLQQEEGLSGTKRKDILVPAYQRGDSGRVVRIFQAYASEHTDPAVPARQLQTPVTGAAPVSLETLAAPGRGSPASPGAQPEKRIWTAPQISAFYRDCADGRYAQREAERARIDQDIFAAGTEGRIR